VWRGRDLDGRIAPPNKRYDRAYFDKWYRDPRHRVSSSGAVARRVAMVVSLAEYLLERPVRTMLDVGAGEGAWAVELASLRPRARYVGVDPSEYAVQRYGAERNLRLGTFGELNALRLRGRFDVVVCSGMLNYLADDELARGLRHLHALLRGVAYLELFTSRDDVEGDTTGWRQRPRAYYGRLLHRLGFVQCGPHCWLPRDFDGVITQMETSPAP
jgi:SAM-dependent methyltransferase